MSRYDLIIIGGGPAGLSAALYASRAGLKTLILEKGAVGGQLNAIHLIENYPAFSSISGVELADSMTKHAKKFGAEIIEFAEVREFELGTIKKMKTINTTYEAKTIIIATGSEPAKLGVKGEHERLGKGVSYCGVCDAPFFKDKIVIVVGGGSSALSAAVYLAKFAKSVTVIHRRAEFRAEKAVIDMAKNNPKIKFMLESTVQEICGNEKLEFVKIKNLKTGAYSELKTDGLFIYTGAVPNSAFVKGKLALDEKGYIKINENMETNIKGVFAAGDIVSSQAKQVVIAAGQAALAAICAEKFISGD